MQERCQVHKRCRIETLDRSQAETNLTEHGTALGEMQHVEGLAVAVGTHSLRFGIVLGQRAPWPDLLARAKEVEARGYDDFNVVDHFFGLRDVMDPTHEAYTILGALAPFTERVRLGVMVCGNTYRNPAFHLKQAVTV